MRRLRVAVLVVAVLAALDGIGYVTTGIANPVVLGELEAVRIATARYQ